MDQFWRFLDGGPVQGGIFTPESVLLSLLLAFVLGQVLAWVYYGTHCGLSYSRSFVQALILDPPFHCRQEVGQKSVPVVECCVKIPPLQVRVRSIGSLALGNSLPFHCRCSFSHSSCTCPSTRRCGRAEPVQTSLRSRLAS